MSEEQTEKHEEIEEKEEGEEEEEEEGVREWRNILLGVAFIFVVVVGWYVISLFTH